MVQTVVGTLRFNEFEGGFWSIEPEDGRQALVLDGWTPPRLDAPEAPSTGEPSLTDGSRVRARVRAREAQFGFLMAGTYVDVESVQLA